MRKLVLLTTVWLMYVALVPAQSPAQATSNSNVVPTLVNYSGRALDGTGKPVAGIAGIMFSVYKDESGGSPLWFETQNVRADARGNYTVQLGATLPEGLPLSLFTSGEARWLGVRINGGEEQPRTLFLSVPYALKAADAQTLGGLPASAFVLAAPPIGGTSTGTKSEGAVSAATATATQSPATGNTPVTTAGGSNGKIPLWDSTTDITSSIITQTCSGSSAKLGINIAAPLLTLDVNGGELVRGLFEMATTGFATASKGFSSNPLNIESSAFSSSTSKYTLNHFQWQAEPVGNNTTKPGATLNLLYGQDPNPPTETGLKLASNGQFTFAPGQKFPGTGSVTSVGLSAPTSDFTVSGSPVTTSGTLGLAWKVAPTNANTANAIVKRDGSGGFVAGQITAFSSASNGAIIGTNFGISALGPGVAGISNSGFGVSGTSSDGYGVYGNGTNVVGVYGVSANGDGVQGYTSGPGYGVSGTNASINGTGVFGYGAEGGYFLGLPLSDATAPGAVVAQGATNIDSYGEPGGAFFGGDGSAGFAGGDGLWAVAGGPAPSYAGYFFGDVSVTGTLSKGGGSFKIDHPLDPANKYLSHSFVESPDMMNVYNGNIVLDSKGEATVQLPEWFETLNRDFRYQLTSIGGFAPIYIAQKVHDNTFKIAGGKPGMEISWQVTGIRQDPWANAHRIPVEQQKDVRERGFYLHPELYGQPSERAVQWARNPEGMRFKQRAHAAKPRP